jgi:translocon-associated protein subunit alpha
MEDPIEDSLEGELDDEGDATIETDEGGPEADMPGTDAIPTDQATEEEEEEEKPLKPSPDGDTVILFTRPAIGTDFPAGALVKFLVGFTNKGDKEFLVETMEASFRYPQDYSFYIQNFTTVRYERVVEPSRQATFEYAFTPSETFNARPFGLTINLNYKDAEGNLFQDAVFNETINIVEPDEGLDGETFFLYVFLAAVAVLLLVGAQQLLATFGKKRLSKPKPIEMGTQSKTDVDFDWLPKETLTINKSPRRSPKQSPGRRRTKRSTGGGAED